MESKLPSYPIWLEATTDRLLALLRTPGSALMRRHLYPVVRRFLPRGARLLGLARARRLRVAPQGRSGRR